MSQSGPVNVKCVCPYCKQEFAPETAVEHLRQCQLRIQQLDAKGKHETPERARLVCPCCKGKVNAKNLVKHIVQQHSVDGAALTGISPKAVKQVKPKVVMLTKRGTRTVGFRPCDNCQVVHMDHWTYQFSDGTSKTVCRFCKGMLLDKAAKRKTDVLDHCVPGSAMNGKRR